MLSNLPKQARLFQVFTMAVLLLAISCQKELKPTKEKETQNVTRFTNSGNALGDVSPEMVLRWNEAATYVVSQTQSAIPNPPITPLIESRYYAMVNIAMHDALNNIVPKYKTYALNAGDKEANPDAAVSQAAHDVIAYFFGKLNPPANITPQPVQDYINNLLSQSLNAIQNGNAKTKGIALGTVAAQAIIQKRINDGSANVMFPVTEGTAPGQYRFYFPFTVPPFPLPSPPFSGFYDSPGWGDLPTFGIQNSTQFSVPPPYDINGPEYAEDYNEVKRLGCATCTGINGRTQEQENIAKFWVENSCFGWNKIARKIIEQKNGMSAWKVARLFALLQMSEADAYTACLKAKMIHFFWRPVTAIHLGDNDGNPNTTGDPNWEVLWFPTPPVADHPSGHATAGGAAAELIRNFFGKDNFVFSFESSTLPGSRSFKSLSQAARENSLSRIYVGYHFRKACLDGETLGKSIGRWIAVHSLPEN